VQKKRCPFFFFPPRDSVVVLSLSESSPSAPSSASPSPISTSESPASWDLSDRFEPSRFRDVSSSLRQSGVCIDVSGPDGKGRWPATPPKLCRVGVCGADPSARACFDGGLANRAFGFGVVGVFSSPDRALCGALSEVLTSVKAAAIARWPAIVGCWLPVRLTADSARRSVLLPSMQTPRRNDTQSNCGSVNLQRPLQTAKWRVEVFESKTGRYASGWPGSALLRLREASKRAQRLADDTRPLAIFQPTLSPRQMPLRKDCERKGTRGAVPERRYRIDRKRKGRQVVRHTA